MQVTFDEEPTTEDLEHFGIKGMKWGVRKKQAFNSGYSSGSRNVDQKKFGNGGVRRISKRMDKGKTLKEARRAERNRQVVTGVATGAAVGWAIRHPDAIRNAVARLDAVAKLAPIALKNMKYAKQAAAFAGSTNMQLPAKSVINATGTVLNEVRKRF